ncbi:hypothetical protein LEP1GSC016_0226 [Leptospira borgpetersenii serovar Hardjo-bovis str. Sponselee]|uniref:Uncharacterized protein n=7 Tax=Leptospira borgpetersenii TaxID=174 RepID=M3HVL6_LEPBO|nr:hypothetical protein LBBP_01915 [Leptospira borgpetersenii serovar Ballum]EKP13173.1 hypothetical protein LEP1GSC128_3040 [Leptospira borgpetersenii str. 200801926]EKQ92073.1 hypothetical protein LEP1GSC101_3377 [Leptospira borgpetersenii str. UI 09149]EKR02028.1 hypothetical protein LEP1GSC121_3978 [Leptospira borgpetersenii serovar Castellonis str. 200801910]EMG02071.1 hypothetical protein LEP1GSC123_4373 [Leptospira borgpetersenii str. 200701203]EMJ83593.1 hypothetical protein LEP1GSC016
MEFRLSDQNTSVGEFSNSSQSMIAISVLATPPGLISLPEIFC